MKQKKVTKKLLNDVCKCIMYDSAHYKHLGESSKLWKEDEKWLIDNIFKYHPNWNKKGKDIDFVYIDKNDYGTRSFWIKYKDGHKDDISKTKCINNMSKDDLNNIWIGWRLFNVLTFNNIEFDNV